MSKPRIAPAIEAVLDWPPYMVAGKALLAHARRELRDVRAFVRHCRKLHSTWFPLPHSPSCKSCRLLARLERGKGKP